ncbi:hypothetical protein GGS23DRAFT_609197 [Durotheca rogersii]|uniref:uncharacterized protein n=1 Tax=Durotheca rogersii TaxID=419775 RepID=UPI00221EBB96|nr:uncharacterized protein GGS23DRAFT_609197 [Durotheca rogersii]KAI5868517.1 hypothetical protein GGS23DRAFT_609197 [Durotheca rogersii]
MIERATGAQHARTPAQAGSTAKGWDSEELRRCGAIGTTTPRVLGLENAVHPVFAGWAGSDAEVALRAELEQPLRLASRVLRAAGLPWASDFLAHGVFAPDYGGRAPSCRCSFGSGLGPAGAAAAASAGPAAASAAAATTTIVRHHRRRRRNAGSSQEHSVGGEEDARERGGQRDEWLRTAEARLADEAVARATTWQLDARIFRQRGWVGYTCRHPRCGGASLAVSDDGHGATRSGGDGGRNREGDDEPAGRASRYNDLTILVAAEFPARMAELRRCGKEHGEEYLLTAFMAAVTILHELGHAIYWIDRRAVPGNLHEPFYGGDLEMELGDSFVASVFGGWVPVPIGDLTEADREGGGGRRGTKLGFEDGLAWRQFLSWDYHRLRPKHRAHYSISVDYVARLFSEQCWLDMRDDPARDLIWPRVLTTEDVLGEVGICARAATAGGHATAAIADFHCAGEGWVWNRLPGGQFRIPQYDGYLCPDMDLPVATDDVIEEPRPRLSSYTTTLLTPPSSTIVTTAVTLKPAAVQIMGVGSGKAGQTSVHRTRPVTTMPSVGHDKNHEKSNNDAYGKKKNDRPRRRGHCGAKETGEEGISARTRLCMVERPVLGDRPSKSEISLDELRSRLSQLLGVSLYELEELFEASRCA